MGAPYIIPGGIPIIPGGMEMGGGLMSGPPMSGGPGIIWWCRMGVIMGPPMVMLMGGPVTLTGNLCIMAAWWFMASTCFCWWAAACWAAETAVAKSEAAVLDVEAPSSDFDGIDFAYLGYLALISSKDMSSVGWMILLEAPVVAIVATLEPSLLPPGVFVVGGALIVAPEEMGLKSAPTTGADGPPGEEVGIALGNKGLAAPPCPCIIACM